jgi:xanthine dehydrogenase accessory factor
MAILGWRDCVVEHRGRWLTFARQTGVRDIIELDPDSAAQVWVGQSANAAVVMSHNFSIDCCNLRHCAKSELPYIGLIGPRARRDAILMELGAEATTLLHGRLHAPVGLNLGGAGPEALGLSIVAELQQQFGTRRLQVQASSRNQVLDPTKAWC